MSSTKDKSMVGRVALFLLLIIILMVFYAIIAGPVYYLTERGFLPEQQVRLIIKPWVWLASNWSPYGKYIDWWIIKGGGN
jgi:hypothetical protein